MAKRNSRKTDRRFAVLRLLEKERELIAGLGQGPEYADDDLQTRDGVMRLLAEIARLNQPPGGPFQQTEEADYGVKGLKLRELAKKIGAIRLTEASERSSLRVSMPQSLDAELDRLAAITGHTKVALLIQLATHFRDRYEKVVGAGPKTSSGGNADPSGDRGESADAPVAHEGQAASEGV